MLGRWESKKSGHQYGMRSEYLFSAVIRVARFQPASNLLAASHKADSLDLGGSVSAIQFLLTLRTLLAFIDCVHGNDEVNYRCGALHVLASPAG